ncbi:MAG: NusG domain II-containing protein [Candidatus Krumholzibacteriia bacterium]
MTSRRSFFKTAVLGGAAFAAGLKLGDALDGGPRRRLTLHGFVPATERGVRQVLAAFLAAETGALPAPTVDAPQAWRSAVAGSLREASPRYVRDRGRLFDVQVSLLERPLPADLLLQQDDRVLDPAGQFSRRLRELRDELRGHEAQLAVTCRLAPRPQATSAGRVLVVENERGVQDRIALDGAERRLELRGPAGLTSVLVGEAGARVVAASCRHQTCRRLGAVSQPGQLVACAPNRLVLRVETA